MVERHCMRVADRTASARAAIGSACMADASALTAFAIAYDLSRSCPARISALVHVSLSEHILSFGRRFAMPESSILMASLTESSIAAIRATKLSV